MTAASELRTQGEAWNELLFREVNERIEEIARKDGPEAVFEFLCECGRAACTQTLVVKVADYDRVRAHSARFVVADGHENGDERVVERRDGHVVVEKLGEAAEAAARYDPRASPLSRSSASAHELMQ